MKVDGQEIDVLAAVQPRLRHDANAGTQYTWIAGTSYVGREEESDPGSFYPTSIAEERGGGRGEAAKTGQRQWSGTIVMEQPETEGDSLPDKLKEEAVDEISF